MDRIAGSGRIAESVASETGAAIDLLHCFIERAVKDDIGGSRYQSRELMQIRRICDLADEKRA